MNAPRIQRPTTPRHVPWRALGAALLWLTACQSAGNTPEAQIRMMVERAETLAESKDLAGLKTLISDRYRDSAAQDKRAIVGLLFVHLRRNESIHLLTRIDRIEIRQPGATVTVFAAMAGRPMANAADLPLVRADLYRFDLGLVNEDGTWRVHEAAWRPAVPTDFLTSDDGEP